MESEVVYLALGIDEDGRREVLTFFPASAGESAQLWKEVLADWQRRGLAEPLLFVGDGWSGLEEAIPRIYPKADFQSCLLHKMRQSLARARRREREALAEDLRQMVHQRDSTGFQQALSEFERVWGRTYPEVVSCWQKDRFVLTTYLRYPHELQPFIYTTHALERFCQEVKRRTKVIESFSGPEAQEKILFLVVEQMNESYRKRMLRHWQLVKPTLEQMRAQKYGERVVPQEERVAVAKE